jgi:hypothetical protein
MNLITYWSHNILDWIEASVMIFGSHPYMIYLPHDLQRQVSVQLAQNNKRLRECSELQPQAWSSFL